MEIERKNSFVFVNKICNVLSIKMKHKYKPDNLLHCCIHICSWVGFWIHQFCGVHVHLDNTVVEHFLKIYLIFELYLMNVNLQNQRNGCDISWWSGCCYFVSQINHLLNALDKLASNLESNGST